MHNNEILTDNSKIKKYQQCKTCNLRDNGDVWSNSYDKGCCQIYVYPDMKPPEIMNNEKECEFYEER